jgi:hypothetical protein
MSPDQTTSVPERLGNASDAFDFNGRRSDLMKWGMVGLISGALAVSLVGCSEQPASPVIDDGEMNQLVQRTLALKDKVAAVGRMTPEHRVALALLERDINAWQARTGRNDISTSTSAPVRDGRLATVPTGGGSDSCKPCPGYYVQGDQVCFLVDEGPCPDPDDEIGLHTCVYSCIYIGPIKPIKPIIKPKVPTVPLSR